MSISDCIYCTMIRTFALHLKNVINWTCLKDDQDSCCSRKESSVVVHTTGE